MLKLPEPVSEALGRLETAGFEAYIVGGCVRDHLLGRSPLDYDITTSAEPEETLGVFSGFKVILTGLKHGTVTVVCGGMPLEITAFRSDGDYSDGRHPDSVRFTKSLREDAARRDFTMNAVAYGLTSGFIDHYGGIPDIERRVIRCVGEPERRFSEDALRVLRALRFSSVLGFEIESATLAALNAAGPLLRRISAERISAELAKLLAGKRAADALRLGGDALSALLPDTDLRRVADTLDSLGAEAPSAVKLAALCFYSPDPAGLAKSLRFDGDTVRRTAVLCRLAARPAESGRAEVKRTLKALDDALLPVGETFAMLAGLRAALSGEPSDGAADAAADDILRSGECFTLRQLAVNGRTLGEAGIPQGHATGEILNALLDGVLGGSIANERAKLLEYAKSLVKQQTNA